MHNVQLIMGSKEMSNKIATRHRRLRLKENLDVDAPAKTGVCMNYLEEKRDKSVGERLHLFILRRVLLDSPQAALADCFRLLMVANPSGRKILPTKPFEKVLAT